MKRDLCFGNLRPQLQRLINALLGAAIDDRVIREMRTRRDRRVRRDCAKLLNVSLLSHL